MCSENSSGRRPHRNTETPKLQCATGIKSGCWTASTTSGYRLQSHYAPCHRKGGGRHQRARRPKPDGRPLVPSKRLLPDVAEWAAARARLYSTPRRPGGCSAGGRSAPMQHGFRMLREKGSIRYYAKPGVDRLIRTDYHGAKEVPTGTCQAILKAAGLSTGETGRLTSSIRSSSKLPRIRRSLGFFLRISKGSPALDTRLRIVCTKLAGEWKNTSNS